MRIGIVCYPTVGGSGVLATELGHQLALRGHEVHFITYALPFRLRLEEKNLFFHEVEISRYELFQYPDYALPLAVKIAAVAERHRLELLHVHYAIPHATSAFLAKQILKSCRPAVVTTLHGTDITLVGREPTYFEIVKFSMERSCAVTAVSHNLAEETRRIFSPEKEIEVIHNFFVPDKELAGKRALRGNFVKGEEKLLLHASNYRPVKRAQDVLEIYRRVREKLPAKLLFLGSGETIGEVRQKVREFGLEESVFFLGEIRDIDAYLASGDLFLLPSEQESFGLAALEAMAYGLPVVASSAGGIPELVAEGESGYLLPCGDLEGMAAAAVGILSDAALQKKMGEAASIRAQKIFSADKIVPQYEALYRRVKEGL